MCIAMPTCQLWDSAARVRSGVFVVHVSAWAESEYQLCQQGRQCEHLIIGSSRWPNTTHLLVRKSGRNRRLNRVAKSPLMGCGNSSDRRRDELSRDLSSTTPVGYNLIMGTIRTSVIRKLYGRTKSIQDRQEQAARITRAYEHIAAPMNHG